ncbi:MAG: response regulator [Verrucomicrobiae bacterium]|nr:response regulator [Verrucomicrobiae bacterium]
MALSGQVTYSDRGTFFIIENEGIALQAFTNGSHMITSGSIVDVEGTLQLEEFIPSVSATIVQSKGFSNFPELSARGIDCYNEANHCKRVRAAGTVISIESKGENHEILLEENGVLCRAALTGAVADFEALALENGCRIVVSGPYFANAKESINPVIYLNSIDDIQVLNRPWIFGTMHAHTLVFGLLLAVALIWIWTVSLRLKVTKRTRELVDVTGRLRAAYEANQSAIAVVDKDGLVLECNAKFADSFGYALAIGDSFEQFHQHVLEHASNAPAVAEAWDALAANPAAEDTFEMQCNVKTEGIFEVHSAPVGDGTNRPRVWSFHDLTEKKQLQRSLVQAQKMEAIGRLAGGIAHDFNNLLTGIMGNLEIAKLNKDLPLGQSLELIVSAEAAAQRASVLIKQLLGYSRKSTLEICPGNMNDIVYELVGLLKHSVDTSIRIDVTIADDLWGALMDSTHLEQVLMNLCVNARDALPETGGRISIETENITRPEGDFVCVSVKDNGSGISKAAQMRIFEPFFTTKEQGKGTGLGLAMSYGIVKQHNGVIECQSEVGIGTSFRVFIPRSEEGASLERNDAIVDLPVADGSGRILVADDEEVVRAVCSGMLRRHGYEVSTVGDGKEALEYLASGAKVDLVILDLTMPRMSGKETLIQVRRRYPQIPVIISSGYLVDLDAFAGEVGSRPDAFVAKPFVINSMLRAVAECLKTSGVQPV